MAKFERQDIIIRTMASGDKLTIPVWKFSGEQPGYKVYIQANIHGPEIAGIGACRELINVLMKEEICGSVVVVPTANPCGLNSKINNLQIGYTDLNDSAVGNFNREYKLLVKDQKGSCDGKSGLIDLDGFIEKYSESDLDVIVSQFEQELFGSLENVKIKDGRNGLRYGLKLALTLQQLALDSNFVIDLHTGEKAVHFCYTFNECFESAKYFNIGSFIELADEFEGVFDEAFLLPWIRLHRKLKKAGKEFAFSKFNKEAFTLELGSGDRINSISMKEDAARLVNFLRCKGVLKGSGEKMLSKYVKCKHEDLCSYYSPTGGLILWQKKVGDWVKEGEVLAYLIQPGKEDQSEIPVKAKDNGLINNMAPTHVVHEGMHLCSIMSKTCEI